MRQNGQTNLINLSQSMSYVNPRHYRPKYLRVEPRKVEVAYNKNQLTSPKHKPRPDRVSIYGREALA